ncbi:alanine acetyltransferase, partial [Mesorhizobium sp. M00.F.Ca.ET.186.01.1.1]
MNSSALFQEFPVLKSDHLILREIEDCHL